MKASGVADDEPTPIEIYIYGEIGGWGITANQFLRDLKAVDDGVSPVHVAFNTNGGDLFEGVAIHNALHRLGERCTARIDALAASAGSVAVCGAHRVVMASNAILMIHNPYTWIEGDAEELRRVADVLDQAFEVIIAAYKAKSPDIDEVELRRLVNAESWLTAEEALALGLVDEIGSGVQVRACLGNGAAMARYQKTPQAWLLGNCSVWSPLPASSRRITPQPRMEARRPFAFFMPLSVSPTRFSSHAQCCLPDFIFCINCSPYLSHQPLVNNAVGVILVRPNQRMLLQFYAIWNAEHDAESCGIAHRGSHNKENSMSHTKFSLMFSAKVEKTRAIPWSDGSNRRFAAFFFPSDGDPSLPPSR